MTQPTTLLRLAAAGALALASLWLVVRFVVLQPSNQRTWEYGMQTLPHITIADSVVNVQQERDFRWSATGPVSSGYVDRTFDVNRLERVWLIQEPFTIPPFNAFKGVAHTYFVFDFLDQAPVLVSVEARREQGEAYDAFRGLFNEYELIYVWATEEDISGRRAVLEKNQLYMYPLAGSMDSARRLF